MARTSVHLKTESVFRIWHSLFMQEFQADMVKTLERLHGFSAPLSTWQLIYDHNFLKAHHTYQV